jgi:hypothetical protein
MEMFDAEYTVIFLHLSESDRRNIAGMEKDATLYAAFPSGTNASRVKKALAYWKRRIRKDGGEVTECQT